jgi:hypothetical protein
MPAGPGSWRSLGKPAAQISNEHWCYALAHLRRVGPGCHLPAPNFPAPDWAGARPVLRAWAARRRRTVERSLTALQVRSDSYHCREAAACGGTEPSRQGTSTAGARYQAVRPENRAHAAGPGTRDGGARPGPDSARKTAAGSSRADDPACSKVRATPRRPSPCPRSPPPLTSLPPPGTGASGPPASSSSWSRATPLWTAFRAFRVAPTPPRLSRRQPAPTGGSRRCGPSYVRSTTASRQSPPPPRPLRRHCSTPARGRRGPPPA